MNPHEQAPAPLETPLAALPEDLRRTLDRSFVIRTTMTRRRSGGKRTVETTYTWNGRDRVYLSGYPGRRDWVANMASNPSVVVTTVEGERCYEIPATALVLKDRNERVEHLLAFIERWAERPDFPRRRFAFLLGAIRLNRRFHLPWWGPFYLVRRILDRMPCVELRFTGEPRLLEDDPPEPS